MAVDYNVLDYAERVKPRTRQYQDLTGLSTGSTGSDILSAGLFVVAAYALLLAQDVILFTLAFMAFCFVYNPVRIRTGQTVVRDTSNIL